MTRADPGGGSPDLARIIDRAFGAENRARLLDRYFAQASTDVPAWAHVYRLLLWTDRTTGLAHCYESDKAQPGRPWYARTLAFHDWCASNLGVAPGELGTEIDWLFREASMELAGRASEARREAAQDQLSNYADRGFPQPGQDPELVEMILDALDGWISERPPADVMQALTEQIHTYVGQENKRRNLIGEGFEDTLATIIRRKNAQSVSFVGTRVPLHELSGFNPPRAGEKAKKVDLALLHSEGDQRVLVTAKWSIRADREEQFGTDYEAYVRLENLNRPFEYVLITNEFDPARLVNACDRQVGNRSLFDTVVHVNPAALSATYGARLTRSFPKAVERIESGRVVGLDEWLGRLT